MGHLALHYRKASDRAAVIKLMDHLGFARLPAPEAFPYLHYVVDNDSALTGDNILYLVEQPKVLQDLGDAIREALKVGQPGEHPAVAQVRAAQNSDPEFNLHLGVLYSSLDAIEAAVLGLQDAIEKDPDLKGRAKIIINRARPGTPEIDQRMDSSPVFGGIERTTYGFHGIQVFIETDLFSADPVGDVFVFELDYLFPGYDDNILTNPTGLPIAAE
jgi:hypothetical protein